MRQEDRIALRDWAEYLADIRNATPVEQGLSQAEREKKRPPEDGAR